MAVSCECGILFLLSFIVDSKGSKATTCEIPSVYFGQETTLTCFFGVDISKRGVSIHKFNEGSSDQDTVLVCDWLTADTPVCNTRKGYQLKRHSGSILELKILNATEATVGKYVCQVVPSDQSSPQLCVFEVKERTNRDNKSSGAEGIQNEPVLLSDVFWETEEDSINRGLLVFLCVGVPCALIAISYFFRKRRPSDRAPSLYRHRRKKKISEKSFKMTAIVGQSDEERISQTSRTSAENGFTDTQQTSSIDTPAPGSSSRVSTARPKRETSVTTVAEIAQVPTNTS